MADQEKIQIRMFGALHTLRRERGLPSQAEVLVPSSGRSARDIATELDLPLNRIEGVFINHRVFGMDDLIYPGDRVALVPPGVPGPHRFLLGIHQAGKESER